MTEKTANTEYSGKIDWIAFIGALLLAPAVITALGIAIAFATVPVDAGLGASALVLVLAPIFGIKSYLLFGTPVFFAHLNWIGSSPFGLAAAAFVANLISIPMIYLDAELAGKDGMHFVENVVGLGCFVAPIWGFTFGLIYKAVNND